MSLSAVFKYMAKQAVDCRNMIRVKVWHTHTTVWLLKNYSQRILTYYTRILLLDLTYGRTRIVAIRQQLPRATNNWVNMSTSLLTLWSTADVG